MKRMQSHELNGELALKSWLDSLHEHTVLGELVDGDRPAENDFFLIKIGNLWVGPRSNFQLGGCTSAELAHRMATLNQDISLEIMAIPPHAMESDHVVSELADWVHRGAHMHEGEDTDCTQPEHQGMAERGARHVLRMVLRAAVGANAF